MKSMTRKIVQLVVASAIGLGGLGFVLADGKDGNKPAPPMPVPVQPGAAIAKAPPTIPTVANRLNEPTWQRMEADAREHISAAVVNNSAGDRFAMVQALCVRMPAGFCEQAGLTIDSNSQSRKPGMPSVWTLARRESRMFNSLIRADPLHEIISYPSIMTRDERAARVNIGQTIDAITELEPSVQNGKTVYIPTTKKLDLGVSLMVTPKISVDGKRVTLAVESNSAELLGGMIEIPIKTNQTANETKQAMPVRIVGPGAVNKSAFRVNAEIGNGETVVIRSALDGKKQELIWMLTVHLGVGQKK